VPRILEAGKAMLLGALLVAPTVLAQQAKDVCGKRPGCSVKDTTPAIKGHEVVELSLGPRDPEEGPACEQREWWLRRPGKPVAKLLEACNDGYGAAGIGEEEVEIAENRFTHTRSGGSNWRWTNTVVAQLSPLSLISEESSTSHSSSPEASNTRFDYVTFESKSVREVPDCKVPEGEVNFDTATTPLEARLVPQVTLPADFLKEGWKRTGLGRCSAEAAFVLLGKAEGATDAQLRAVLAQDDWLFLEVVDDTWTGPGAKWLTDDHVELWLFPEVPESADPCGRGGKDVGLVQWAIRISDGKVFPAYGDPKPTLKAEVIREPGRARLKVKLPENLRAVTAVYSDSDSGKKQELLVATSALKFGRAATLSPVRSLAPTEASCQVKGAELAPAPSELRPPEGEAALPD
jgi:hypothetical protein